VDVRRRAAVPAVLVASVVALSGCSIGQIGVHAGSLRQKSGASISVSPRASATPVAPGTPVVVTAVAGRLTDVTVTGPSGAVTGSLSADGRTWTASATTLDYGAKYVVAAHAVDRSGLPTDFSETIRTVAPSKFLRYSVFPSQGSIVGVGMPLTVTFDHRLSTAGAKAAFENATTVTADDSEVSGGWRWLSDHLAVYRPETYWPGHATIAVRSRLTGVRFSSTLWGGANPTTTFSTTAAMVSYVDMKTDQLTVTQDGRTIRTIPITTGKPGFETRSGVKVIENKELSRIMDASTGGTLKTDPEYYRLEVKYAMRLTDSGEFLHAAPWSVAHQGHTNVSHGCTGMSTANAAWLYGVSHIGDVVVYTGSTRPMNLGNGITAWNVPWDSWATYGASAV
jgi:lipoprotein-anchoring transpeptidase ErfK/SrfK